MKCDITYLFMWEQPISCLLGPTLRLCTKFHANMLFSTETYEICSTCRRDIININHWHWLLSLCFSNWEIYLEEQRQTTWELAKYEAKHQDLAIVVLRYKRYAVLSLWSRRAPSPAGWPVSWPDSVCSSSRPTRWTWPTRRTGCGWSSGRRRSRPAPSCPAGWSEWRPRSSSPGGGQEKSTCKKACFEKEKLVKVNV